MLVGEQLGMAISEPDVAANKVQLDEFHQSELIYTLHFCS